ncbi:MAG TPA: FIST N-terminal domain-containing protein [Candidatus Udaeobacter sp.]|jgi:small ligand-binding sensory domain FIST|nr:FIST N-terminal domain-containing protein [Candidatus Udaeobacter sp.]
MRWASASSTLDDTVSAANAAAGSARAALGDGPVDLVLAFYTATHVPAAEALSEALKQSLAPACLIGCSARGVVSTRHELESDPALSVIAARLPGVELHPFVLVNAGWSAAAERREEFERHAPHTLGAELVLLFGDPFSLEPERVLTGFNRFAPGVRVVGGMASAGMSPQSNALLLNDWVSREGGVGLALKGGLRVDVVVSQGCQPIGPPIEVTRVEQNLLIELDGQPALERAEQVLRALPDSERERLSSGLYVGRPARGEASSRGDYLIRNLLGADRDRGVIAVGDALAIGERIRLHVRDARTAREDLELLLSPQPFDSAPSAALLFACNGRGRGLYGVADGDITTLQDALGGGVPASGMFCAGEIGPVGDRNFLHGHTASIAIVRSA